MKNKNTYLGRNIAFGMLLGVIMGIVLKNIGLWIGAGMMVGVVRANYVYSREKNKE